MKTSTTNWYDHKWLIVITCITFFPVGLYALWMNQSIAKGWKIGITIIVGFAFLGVISGGDKKAGEPTAEATVDAEAPKLSQAQMDSVAAVEKASAIEARKSNTIGAAELVYMYTQNEVSADANAKGKTFYVTGIISNIGKDIMDEIYITLKSNDDFREVQCYIDDEQVVAQLQKGQKVTVYGTCDGLMMNVQMKDCKLVENLQ